jgi:hypothetical protein
MKWYKKILFRNYRHVRKSWFVGLIKHDTIMYYAFLVFNWYLTTTDFFLFPFKNSCFLQQVEWTVQNTHNIWFHLFFIQLIMYIYIVLIYCTLLSTLLCLTFFFYILNSTPFSLINNNFKCHNTFDLNDFVNMKYHNVSYNTD